MVVQGVVEEVSLLRNNLSLLQLQLQLQEVKEFVRGMKKIKELPRLYLKGIDRISAYFHLMNALEASREAGLRPDRE